MSEVLRRIAMVSMHTSPAAAPGRADAGGMNVAILALARGLADHGIEVDLITRATEEPRSIELSPGVVLHSVAAGPLAVLPKAGLADVADEFGEAVAALIGRTVPYCDLVHSHYWLSGLATLPVALELGIPLVQSFHTLAAMKNLALAAGDKPEPERRLRGEAFLASQADAIVAGSTAEVDSLLDDVHAPADRVWVIPPGVDTELFTPSRIVNDVRLRRRLGLATDKPLLVVAGRIQPLKGQELAIRSFAALRATLGWTPALVIAGEPTPGADGYLETLGTLAAGLGVADDVHFVGPLDRPALADLFAAAALTLVPSLSETFGLVALESAASGTPVIAYRGTGLIESVAEGESGVLLDSRDPEHWARVISDLLSDEESLARMQASARRHAEGFTWATSVASLLGVYESLVAR